MSMLLNIAKAKAEPGKVFRAEFEQMPSCEEFPLNYEIVKPVKVAVNYSYTGDTLFVQGEFSAKLKVCCSRCLKEFIYEAKGEFEEEFAHELTDEISYLLEDDNVLIDKLILDRISVELPQRFLCDEDCKGLCPKCGANLNERSCGCNITDDFKTINPFAKLEGLFDNTLGGVTNGSTQEKNEQGS